MQRLAPPQRKFWIVSLVTLIAVGAMSGVGAFGVQYLRTNWGELAAARQELARLEAERGEIVNAGAVLARLEHERSLLAASFADPVSPLPFIESIEELGRRSGLRLELALATGSGGGRGEEYTLTASGGFRGVMSFLKHVESLPFLVRISGVELERAEGLGGPVLAEPSVRLIVAIGIVRP